MGHTHRSDNFICSKTTQTILEILRTSRPDGNFTPLDKLRLVLIFYLSSPDISKDDVAELEKELKSAGAEVAAFDYVRRTREISKMAVSNTLGGTSTPVAGAVGQGAQLFTGLSVFGNKVSILDLLRIRLPSDERYFYSS